MSSDVGRIAARFSCLGLLSAAWLIAFLDSASAGATLESIKQRGTLRCSIQGPSNPGFGVPDSRGNWHGFNVDWCRAVAIMIFNDPAKAEIVPLTTQTDFPALQAGEVDLIAANKTYTLTRDTQLKLNFPAITFYDGQAIMVPAKAKLGSAKQLGGATVCVQPGTATELNLVDYFRKNGMSFTPLVIESRDELRRAYSENRCDALTSDFTTLVAQRTLLPNPAEHVILPERLSKEPLALTVRHGDEEFRDIVAWTVYSLVNAEELGITQANAEQLAASSTDPAVRRLLGSDRGLGQLLGVDDRFGLNLVKELGNYGEIFDRNLGKSSLLKLDRGANRLWSDGGLMYVPPAR
jgi:general L-amino acid transport system substrate-binding protein